MARVRKVSGATAEAGLSSGTFKNYPVGEYIGQIIDVKEGTFAKSGPNAKPSLNIQFKFTEAPDESLVGKKFTAFRVPDFPEFASGSAAWLHFQIYKALGVVFPPKGEDGDVEYPDFDEMLGEEVGIQIGLEDTNKVDEATGEFTKRNSVVRFFPASDGITVPEGGAGDDSEGFTL